MAPIWFFVFYVMMMTPGKEMARSKVYHFHDKEVCEAFRVYEIEAMRKMLPKGANYGYSLECEQVEFEGEKR